MRFGVLGPIAAAVVLLGAFVYVEARVAVAPLVPLSIFRLSRLRAANMIVILLYAAQFPSWFFLTLYMQQVLGYDAIQAGLGFLPMTLTIFATSTPRVSAWPSSVSSVFAHCEASRSSTTSRVIGSNGT